MRGPTTVDSFEPIRGANARTARSTSPTVVGLDVERGERLGVPPGSEPLAQRRDRRHEHDDVLAEAPAVVDGARAGVGGRHLEVEVLDALRRERLDDARGRAPPRPRAARVGHDVEIGEPAERVSRAPGEREPDRRSVVLGEEREPGVDDLADLAELLLGIVVDMGGRRHLELELAPEALERGASSGVAVRTVIARS